MWVSTAASKVFRVEVANDAFLGLSVSAEDGGPAVVVNTWNRLAVEHWIYSAAHELGHLLLHLDAYDVTREEEDNTEEKEAEQFASHFLMPCEAFSNEWRDTSGLSLLDRVLKVKRVFRVSWRTVMYRVTESVPQHERQRWWQRIHIEHKRRTRRPLLKLTEPNGVEPTMFREPVIASRGTEPAQLDVHDFQGDRPARLVRQAVEQELITLGRAAEILGLSLTEMRDRSASWLG